MVPFSSSLFTTTTESAEITRRLACEHARAEGLAAELAASQRELVRMEEALEEREGRACAAVEELRLVQRQAKEVQHEHTRLRKTLSAKANDETSELRSRISAMESAVIEKQDEVKDLHSQLSAHIAEKKGHKRALKEMRDRLAEAEAAREAQTLSAQEELDKLRQKSVLCEEQSDFARIDLDKMGHHCKVLKEELSRKHQEVDALEEARYHLEQNIHEMQEGTLRFKEKYDDKGKEVKKLKEALKQTVDEANQKIDSLNEENNRLENIANQHRTDLETLGRKHERSIRRATLQNVRENLQLVAGDSSPLAIDGDSPFLRTVVEGESPLLITSHPEHVGSP